MKTFIRIILLVIFVIISLNLCRAQHINDTTLIQIETIEGNSYAGTILSQDSLVIKFRTTNIGDISINKTEIKKIIPISKEMIKEGRVWFDNPQAARYFWAPNGYGLKEGEAYYQNVWVLFNQFSVGITDNISIGGGLVPLFLFAGASTPIWITPKFSIPIVENSIHLGGGALLGVVLGEANSGFGILYGVSTFGSKNYNVNVGIGYGYAGDSWSKSPVVNISALLRTGPRGYFISENYYIRAGDDILVLGSLGGRSILRGGVGLDYGLIVPISGAFETNVALPWLGITVPISKTAKQNVPPK